MEIQQQENVITKQSLEQYLIDARKLNLDGKFDESIQIFYTALNEGSKFYGNELDYELAKFYFGYGSAIFAKLESQTDVFGQKVDNRQEENDEQEEEEQEEQEDLNQQLEKNSAHYSDDDNQPIIQNENVNQQQDEKMYEKMKEKTDEKINEKKDEQKNQKIDLNQQQIEDFQLAWENIEVARVITDNKWKQISDSSNVQEKKLVLMNLAKSHRRLAELEFWREKYDQSLQEYQKCLEIKFKIEDSNYSREIAEIYFMMGTIHLSDGTNQDCENLALKCFFNAKSILENILMKILNLPQESFKKNELNREAIREGFLDNDHSKEIKYLLGEMYNKIEDTQLQLNEKDQYLKAAEEIRIKDGFDSSQFNNTKNQNVVNLGVISGQIQKRSNETLNELVEPSNEQKRIKLD